MIALEEVRYSGEAESKHSATVKNDPLRVDLNPRFWMICASVM